MGHLAIKRTAAFLLLTALLGVASGCSSDKSASEAQASAATPETGVTVRVAFFPNITHSQALVGQANGEFQKALGDGNKIEWKKFNAGPAEVEALFAGDVDIGYIGPGPAINAYVKSHGDFQIIAGATTGGSVLVSRKDLHITSAKELEGKKVAVPQLGNTQDLSLRNLLNESGLKDTTKGGTVDIVAAENADILTLLQSGKVDAALVPEPWGSRIIKEAGANLVLDYDKVWRNGDYSTAVVIASKEFIEKHPWAIKQFLQAHSELTQYINSNKADAEKLINQELKDLTGKALAQDVLDSAFQRLTVTTDPSRDSVAGFAELSYTAGFVTQKPDTSKLFDLTLLEQVTKSAK